MTTTVTTMKSTMTASTVEKSACFVASYDSVRSFFYVFLKSSAPSGWVPGPWAGLVQGLPANLDFFQSQNRTHCSANFQRDGLCLKVPLGRRAGWFCVLHIGSWLNLKVVLHKRAPMIIAGIDLPPLTAARVDGSDCARISDVAYAHQPAPAIWTLLIWWSQGSVSLIVIAYLCVHCGRNFSKTRDCSHPVRRLRWFCFRLGLCGTVGLAWKCEHSWLNLAHSLLGIGWGC